MDDIPDSFTIISLVEKYSPDELDLVTAELAARARFVELVTSRDRYEPLQVVYLLDTMLQAQLAFIVGVLMETIGDLSDVPEQKIDQDTQMMKSALTLLRYHVGAEQLVRYDEVDREELEDA